MKRARGAAALFAVDWARDGLFRAARRHGFVVERGRQSQLTEFIAYLVQLDEQVSLGALVRQTLRTALGLLAQPGQRSPSDAEVDAILDLRRLADLAHARQAVQVCLEAIVTHDAVSFAASPMSVWSPAECRRRLAP